MILPLRRGLGLLLGLSLLLGSEAYAATYWVDGANPASSDSGPGTEGVPYRTLATAIRLRSGPGVTVLVKPAVYSYGIVLPKSGAGDAPFVVRAVGGGIAEIPHVYVSEREWIEIDGFTIRGTVFIGTSRGITFTNNRVIDTLPTSGSKAFYSNQSVQLRIASNTISGWSHDAIVCRDVSSSVFEDNDISNNANDGLVLNPLNTGSNANLIRRNRFFDNGENAIVAAYDYDNLSIQNVMSGNKHGVQHAGSHRFRQIGDVIVGNTNDGIWIKGGSDHVSIENCIVAENGTGNSSAYNVYVDSASPLPESNDNIYWYSNGQPSFRAEPTVYHSFADWLATGRDYRSVLADPRFVDAAHRDFHLTQRSPAIDAANSDLADWPATDAQGRVPMDDPRIANTGRGSIPYSDRGAFEFVPSTLAVGDLLPIGQDAKLMPIAPNPMRSAGRIEYVVTRATPLRLTVVDLQGRTVVTLADREHAAGRYATTWDGRAANRTVAAGLYFLRLETPSTSTVERFTLMR